MAGSVNKPSQVPNCRPQQQSLSPQLISVSSAAGSTLQATTALPMARPGTAMLLRPSTPVSGSRGLVFIRPTCAVSPAQPQRIILQQTPRSIVPVSSQQQHASGIPPQILSPAVSTSSATLLSSITAPSSIDSGFEQQQDITNSPMATLLRNTPISMRFDTDVRSSVTVPRSLRDVATPLGPRARLMTPGSAQAAAARLLARADPPSISPSNGHPVKRTVTREIEIRVNAHPERKLSVLRYNAYDRVDLAGDVKTENEGDAGATSSSGQEVFLQRENNLRHYRATRNVVEGPTRGAGSEFGQEAKEEARLRRLGIVRQGYRVDDQPWLLTVGKGRTAKRYKGVREGTVSANVRHFIFCAAKDGKFDAYPVDEWYKVNPEVSYRYLRDEEAEAEYSRRHKTMNLFNVMVKRKMVDENTEEGAAEFKEANAQIKTGLASVAPRKGKAEKSSASGMKRNRSSGLFLTDMDVWKDLDADEDEEEAEDDDEDADIAGGEGASKEKRAVDDPKQAEVGGLEKGPKGDTTAPTADGVAATPQKANKQLQQRKKRAAAIVARKRRATKQRARRRRKGALAASSGEDADDLFEEAWDESEPDDREGDEVDYITNSSEDEEKLSDDDREQIYQEQGVDEEAGLKVLLTDISDSEEEQQKRQEATLAVQDEEDDADDEGNDDDVDNKHGLKQGRHKSHHHRHKNRHKRKTSGENGGGAEEGSSGEDSSSGDSSSSSSSTSSDSDSDSDSDSNAAPDDPGRAERKARKKAELFQRISDKVSATMSQQPEDHQQQTPSTSKRPTANQQESEQTSTAAKRQRIEPDDALTAAVRKYLTRKPITVEELLKKIRMKKLVPTSTTSAQISRGVDEAAESMLANALRRLRPIKQFINGKHVLSLKR